MDLGRTRQVASQINQSRTLVMRNVCDSKAVDQRICNIENLFELRMEDQMGTSHVHCQTRE